MADNLNRPAMDLQLFAEGEVVEPAPEETPAESSPQDKPQYGSLSEFISQHFEEPQDKPIEQETTPAESPQTTEEKLILGKFKSQDDLVQAYQEAERKISTYGQDTSKARQELEQLRGQVWQLQQYLQKPQTPQPTAEELQAKNQEWLDKFYENPMDALEEVIQSRVQKIVEPIQKDYQLQQYTRQYQAQIEQARQKYADFDTLQPVMQEVIQEQGQHLAGLPNAVEVIYSIAKGRAAAPINHDQLLQDENFRSKILQNEEIRKAILTQIAQVTKDKQPPVVLGPQQGEPPIMAPEEIKTSKDAKKASISYFKRILGGAN
jgi:hypothetical protein